MTQMDANCPVNEQNPPLKSLSPLRITLLALNAFLFGGFVVMSVREADGPVVLLTVGAGLTFVALFVGAISDSRRYRASLSRKQSVG